MSNVKEKLIDIFTTCLNKGIPDGMLVTESPEGRQIHGVRRLLFYYENGMDFEYYTNGKIESSKAKSGMGFYCARNGYLLMEGPPQPFKGISLSYYGQFIRAMATQSDGVTPTATTADNCIHTCTPVSNAGIKFMDFLDTLADDPHYTLHTGKLLETLLEISLEGMKQDGNESEGFNKTYFLWDKINLHLRNNRGADLSRQAIAEQFEISQDYISHIFKTHTGKNFTDIVTEYRLELAIDLLKNTVMNIAEISSTCGFKYTSYFIRCFKKHYKNTPHSFRNMASRRVS